MYSQSMYLIYIFAITITMFDKTTCDRCMAALILVMCDTTEFRVSVDNTKGGMPIPIHFTKASCVKRWKQKKMDSFKL